LQPDFGQPNFWENELKQLLVDSLSYKTISANKQTADKQWLVVDAEDQILGRF
jgi:large subunit ribosomal protein L13